jgi:hypothetical protein
MSKIATTVSGLTPNMSALVGQALGLSESAIVGASAFLLVKQSIAQVANEANTSMGPAIADINTQWKATDDISRDIGKSIAYLETAFMNANTSASTFASTMQNVGSTIQFAPGVNGNALTNALLQLSTQTSNTNPPLNSNIANSSKIEVTVTATPGTQASVTSSSAALNNSNNSLGTTFGSTNATSSRTITLIP